jgi:signal transduction histidine kinase
MAKAAKIFSKHFLFFLALLLCMNSFAQNPAADTIRRQLAALKPAAPDYLDQKIGALGTLFHSLVHTHPQEAIKVTDELAACLMQKGDSAKYYEALYRHKAIAYEEMGDYTNNILYLEAYAGSLNRMGKGDGYAYVDIGNTYYSLGLRVLAKECYRQAERSFEQENNIPGQCTVHNNYAQIYMAQQQFDSALYELHITNALRENKLKDMVIAGDSKLLIAICFDELHKDDSAKHYYHQVLSLIGSPMLNAHTDHVALQEEYSGAYNRIASMYIREKNWDSAAYYLHKGMPLYVSAGYHRKINNSYATWAKFYLEKGMPDSALANIRRFEDKTRNGNPDSKMRLYKMYADYYNLKDDKEGYYKNMMLYYMLEDSLKSQSINEGSLLASGTMMQLKNKSRIEEQNVELIKKDLVVAEQEKEKFLLYAISGLFLFIISAGIFFFFQIRRKNKLIHHYNIELQEANLTKEKFLSVISHDLRTPFNTLIGMSNVLMNNVKAAKLTDVAANAEAINDASRKAYVLLDNLMQWVSIQKEKISVNKEIVPANETVESVLLLFRNYALGQDVTIQKDIRTSTIFTDKNLLQVVLRNLLSNAVRHISAGGIVKLCVEESGEDIRIIVQDNGRGIDEETLKTIFAKKDHTSIARKGGGLGLLLVQEFVEQLGGTISAENIPSGGAKFTIILHKASAGNATEPEAQEEIMERLKFTQEEKKKMSALAREMEGYEIFDTTELRQCLARFNASGSPDLMEWIKRLSHAVYHSDSDQYKKLLALATL